LTSKQAEVCSSVCAAAALAAKLLQQQGFGGQEAEIYIAPAPDALLHMLAHPAAEVRQRAEAVSAAVPPAVTSGTPAALAQLLKKSLQTDAAPQQLQLRLVEALPALALHSAGVHRLVAAGDAQVLIQILDNFSHSSTSSSTSAAHAQFVQGCSSSAVPHVAAHLQ
jgi:hypothetical protein